MSDHFLFSMEMCRDRFFFLNKLAFLLVLTAVAGCDTSEEKRLSRLVPDLPGDLVHHVVASDDSAFAVFAREVGNRMLRDAFTDMHVALVADSGSVFDERREVLRRPMARISRVLASEYGLHGEDYRRRVLFDRTAGEAWECLRMGMEFWKLKPDRSMPIDQQLSRHMEMLERAREMDLPDLAMNIKASMAEVLREQGRATTSRTYLEDALNDSYVLRMPVMTCQLLGQLGSYHREGGNFDSTMVCYDEALRIAKRHQLPEQAARITTFYADYYQRAGKQAVAMVCYNDAMRYCREFKAGRHEIRFVIWGMQTQAKLGCWEAVGKLIQRARVLEKDFDSAERSGPESHPSLRSYYRAVVDTMEMWWLLARGDVSGARKIHDDIHGYVKKYTKRGEYASFLYIWAEELANNGYFTEAAGTVSTGLSFCRETNVTDWWMKFTYLSARVALGEGMAPEALKNARRFDELYAQSNDMLRHRVRLERLQNLVTRARAHLLLGDTLSAYSTLFGALRELDKSVSETIGSVEGYLWLGRCSDVRELLFDMTERNPLGGYGTALYWQSLGRKLGGQTQQSFAVPVTKETVVRAGTKTAEAVRSRGAIHIVYGIRGNGVWRWTARDGVVVAEMLEVPKDVLQKRVRESIALMSQDPEDPDAPIAGELARTLRLLAKDLLPRPLLEPVDALPTPSLVVTTDGFLGRFPFGALNVGSDITYEPLLSRIDLVYYRHTGADSRLDTDTPWPDDGIVFVVSSPSRYARSRFPLSGVLPGAQREGNIVASAFPRLRRYSGETATKTNLVGSWEHSSILYFASHVYRDPEIPYVTLIPMGALDGDSDPESAFLDVFDIRAADLRDCCVVVLSGCSSGAPAVMRQNSVPGLGDIFLDSGAGATIQTFWDIRDRDEGNPMPGVVARWQESGPGDAGILCDEQRRLLRGPRGFRHPFYWAPYFITLGNL